MPTSQLFIYHLLTDRFCRGAKPLGQPKGPGEFHGGSFQGITRRLRAGWFSQLGVNALWISAPYQQILGWVPGDDNEFPQSAYHGYWPLDFTVAEPRFGSASEFGELVAAAHACGIKVIIDIAIGHCGYPDVASLRHHIPELADIVAADAPPEQLLRALAEHPHIAARWWGADWIRTALPGHEPGGEDDLSICYHGLPRFRLDDDRPVDLPRFLAEKPDSDARPLAQASVLAYLIHWLCTWVAAHGVDGFRCDSAKHVPVSAWQALGRSARAARSAWNGAGQGRADPAPFRMIGEVFGYGPGMATPYGQAFDDLINFESQQQIGAIFRDTDLQDRYLRSLAYYRLEKLYARYAAFQRAAEHGIVSYISSHDTCLMDRSILREAATALMLSPGGVALYYGDETARSPGSERLRDAAQAARSFMNWDTPDEAMLAHWRKLGQFRARHPAVAAGTHIRLDEDPYVFARHLEDAAGRRDVVVVCLGESGLLRLDVSGVFEEGASVRDAYGGAGGRVRGGTIEIAGGDVVLLELDTMAGGAGGRP